MKDKVLNLKNNNLKEINANESDSPTTYATYTRPIYLTSPQMQGDDVRAVQNKLSELGHNPGTIDGYFGSNSDAAVRRFQKSEGLSIDGSVGPATWSKLFELYRYSYSLVQSNGLEIHMIETNLDNIETETILRPLAYTSYTGINGGLFDSDSKYTKPPTSGSSICYNHEDVGKYVTVDGISRIANFHENQLSDVAAGQRTLTIYRSGGTLKYLIKKDMKHVNEAFSAVGESNVLNIIGGTSPELTSSISAMASIGRAAISVNGSKAYLLYCKSASQERFNGALNSGLGKGLTRDNTIMMDGSGSACMRTSSGYIGTEERYIYNIIRVR
ncbi:MAG: peptidoglycan-binding domain-containing protein [Paraclostridium sp.]